MNKFNIEDDYYIIVDEYSYNLARLKGVNEKGKQAWDTISYHGRPEQALDNYIQYKIREKFLANEKADVGSLKDMVQMMAEENMRMRTVLKEAFDAISCWKEGRP